MRSVILLLSIFGAFSLGSLDEPALGFPVGEQPIPAKPGSPSHSAKEKPTRTYELPLPPRPDFSALDWLVGEWRGQTAGRGPVRQIRLAVDFALDKRFIILREETSIAATNTTAAASESWMGVLSANRGDASFDLREFSSNGFITRYRVTVEGPEILLNPEGGDQPPAGWLFRKVVRRLNVGEMTETVQVAPPNKPFFDYYTAKFTRVLPSTGSSSSPEPLNR